MRLPHLMPCAAGARRGCWCCRRPRLPDGLQRALCLSRANGASVTVAGDRGRESQVSAFGILETDRQSRVVGSRKPSSRGPRLASMGVYLFDRASLIRWLLEDAEFETSTHDFGKDLCCRDSSSGARRCLPTRSPTTGRTSARWTRTTRPTRVLSDRPAARPDDPRWGRPHPSADRPPVRFRVERPSRAQPVATAVTSPGMSYARCCFPGVVAGGAVVRDSIVMHDPASAETRSWTAPSWDKEVRSGRADGWATVTPRRRTGRVRAPVERDHPRGKGTSLPAGLTVGRNRAHRRVREEAVFTADVRGGAWSTARSRCTDAPGSPGRARARDQPTRSLSFCPARTRTT